MPWHARVPRLATCHMLPTPGIKHNAAAGPMEDRLSDPFAARASRADHPSLSTLLRNGSASGIASERVIVSFADRSGGFGEYGGGNRLP
jgi:hypothetical protein